MRIEARSRFLVSAKEIGLVAYEWMIEVKILTIMVIINRSTDAEIVLRSEVGFEHQLSISVLLIHVKKCLAKLIFSIMHRTIGHQGYRRVVVGIKDESVLPLEFQAIGADINAIMCQAVWTFVMAAHTACSLIAQSLDAQLTDPLWRHISHTPHTIYLLQLGHVHEAIMVGIVVGLAVFEMQQKACR